MDINNDVEHILGKVALAKLDGQIAETSIQALLMLIFTPKRSKPFPIQEFRTLALMRIVIFS
jgi:hypothetical protein